MKKLAFAAVVVVLTVAAWLLFESTIKHPAPTGPGISSLSPSAGSTASSSASASAAKSASIAPGTISAVSPQAGQLEMDSTPPPNLPPQVALQNVGRAVHQYGDMFGGNPVGTNPEITSQLNGNNPKHANFINPQAGMKVNGNGELVDTWGTPYFFHQISGTDMEIHSAGPDKRMWTTDDLVAK